MKFVSLKDAADFAQENIDPTLTNERIRKLSTRKSLPAWPRKRSPNPSEVWVYGIPVTDADMDHIAAVVGAITSKPIENPEQYTAMASQSDVDVRYHAEVDTDAGVVIAYMPMLKDGFIRVPLSVDKRIHQLYSSEGANVQIMQLAQDLLWQPFIMRGYLRARGLTHASHVWPEWEIESTDIDDLAKDALMAKAEKAKARAEKLEAERIKKDAEIGRSHRDLATFIRSMGFETIPPIKVPNDWSSEATFDVYFPMKDLHVGKYPHKAPSGYSLGEQEKAIIQYIERTLQKIVNTWGVPRRFITVTGDDQLNSNSSNQTTLKGTPVGASSIGSFKEQAMSLKRIKEYQIQACLRTGALVYDHYIPSNHAPDAEFLVAEILRARFADEPRVEFNTEDDTMKVVVCGTIPVFDLHGTRIDDRNLPAAAARMCPPGVNFGRAVIFRGHTHAGATMLQKQAHENAGILIHVVPSSAPACAYEEANLWSSTQHLMAAYRIDYVEGCDSTLFIR